MNPIFVVGSPRSGTSMIHWALAQHSGLWGSAESDFMGDIANAAEHAFETGTRYGDHHWMIKENVGRQEFLRYLGSGIDALYRSRSNDLRWLEQTPNYVFHYETLRSMFPEARFVNIVRDGRFVTRSMQEKFGWKFREAITTWKSHVEAGNEIKDKGRGDVLSLRYESIVHDPEHAMQCIFAFVDEPLQSDCVEFLRHPINASPGRETESPEEKIDEERIEWSGLKKAYFQFSCGRLQSRLGYPRRTTGGENLN